MPNYINRKVVLRNTLMLYLRMGINMVVSLYTSRVVLAVLGVDDFGIYNIVGGVVILFSFMNTTLTVAIRRFIAFGIGKEDGRVDETLKASIIAVLIASVVIFVGLESIGTWFLNNKLNIPEGRIGTANFVFQFSVFTFFINMNVMPYNSSIVTYERMSAFAYISIGETILKLIFVLFLQYISGDKLCWYGFFMMMIAISIGLCNVIYCRKKVIKVGFNTKYSWNEVKSIFAFSAWTVIGTMIGMAATQGVNIIYNIFFGVAVNAAMGIATQITTAVNQFAGNFVTAFNPQLTKSYAAEGLSDNTFRFVCQTTRLTLLLVLLMGLPVIVNINPILHLWLKNVPVYAAQFTIIIIICSAIDACANPLYLLVYAKGELKLYQLILGIIQILYIFTVYVLCTMGLSPVQVLFANIGSISCLFVARLFILKYLMRFPVRRYVEKVIEPIFLPLLVSGFMFYVSLFIEVKSIIPIFCKITVSFIVVAIFLFYLYMDNEERQLLYSFVKNKLNIK